MPCRRVARKARGGGRGPALCSEREVGKVGRRLLSMKRGAWAAPTGRFSVASLGFSRWRGLRLGQG